MQFPYPFQTKLGDKDVEMKGGDTKGEGNWQNVEGKKREIKRGAL